MVLIVTFGYGKLPNYTKEYVLSADVGRGDGSDYSAFSRYGYRNYGTSS